MIRKHKNMAEEDKQKTIRRLKTFFENQREIIFAYVHGSFAEGLPSMDIDIGVFVDDRAVPDDDALDYGINISIRAEMETSIHPLDVKVINYSTIGFQYYVTKGILLFSKDEDKRCDFLERTWKRYFDLLTKRRQILLDLVSP